MAVGGRWSKTTSFLLDTDVASYIFSKRPDARRFLDIVEGGENFISFVTLGEAIRGALDKKWSARRIETLDRHLLQMYTTLPHSERLAREWAQLMATCGSRGVTVTENDAWIAASAVVYKLPLVSNDRIFPQVARHYPSLTLAAPA